MRVACVCVYVKGSKIADFVISTAELQSIAVLLLLLLVKAIETITHNILGVNCIELQKQIIKLIKIYIKKKHNAKTAY